MEENKMINPIVIDKNVKENKMINPIVIDVKDPERKEYLVLLIGIGNNEEHYKDYQFIEGRTATYEHIKNLIDDIDIHESYVLVEGVSLEDRVTVYEFMRHMSMHFFKDDNFNIEDYNQGDEFEIDENGNIEISSFNNKDYI